MDTDLQAKEAPCLPAKKASLSLAAGVACWISLPSAWKMDLQRWQTKSHAQTKHISSVAQKGRSEQREKTTVKSNLNQAQTLEPEESSVLRHPWGQLVKAISLITRRLHSVTQDDICSLGDLTVGPHLHPPLPGCCIWTLLCNQTKSQVRPTASCGQS